MQIYPTTNTYCCFSSNCNAGTGDQIQFIELMQKCTKHEAIVKAIEMTTAEPATVLAVINKRGSNEADLLEKEVVLTKWFSYY